MPRACPVERHDGSYKILQNQVTDATGLPRGASRLELHSCEREPPRHKAVASKRDFFSRCVADIVRLHGTSPWHLFRHDNITAIVARYSIPQS